MAQDRFINISIDPAVATRVDRSNDNHGKAIGSSSSGDLTLSFDMSKITTLSVLRSAVSAAIQQASGILKP